MTLSYLAAFRLRFRTSERSVAAMAIEDALSVPDLIATVRFCNGVIDNLLREVERLTSALTPFADLVPDREEQCGKADGEALVAVQVGLEHLKAAREAIHAATSSGGNYPDAAGLFLRSNPALVLPSGSSAHQVAVIPDSPRTVNA